MEERERWVDIDEGPYRISSLGQLYSVNTNKIVSLQVNSVRGQYLTAKIRVEGKRKHVYIHRLVAKYFVVNQDLVEYTQVDHINGDRKNNCASNLRWCSSYQNAHNSVTLERTREGTRLRVIPSEARLHGIALRKEKYNDPEYVKNARQKIITWSKRIGKAYDVSLFKDGKEIQVFPCLTDCANFLIEKYGLHNPLWKVKKSVYEGYEFNNGFRVERVR
jgi:hypothetical protein